ncbi:hypothetical protein ACRRTK_021568 [Alexandromys fortis]
MCQGGRHSHPDLQLSSLEIRHRSPLRESEDGPACSAHGNTAEYSGNHSRVCGSVPAALDGTTLSGTDPSMLVIKQDDPRTV